MIIFITFVSPLTTVHIFQIYATSKKLRIKNSVKIKLIILKHMEQKQKERSVVPLVLSLQKKLLPLQLQMLPRRFKEGLQA